MVLRGVLLSLHLLGVIVWLGAGLYDLFLDREIERARGTPAEVALARVYTRYGPVIVVAALFVALTGVLQASLLGWGYFRVLWLGAKQLLMLLVLGILAWLLPTFARMGRAVAAHSDGAGELSDEARALFRRVRPYVLAMRGAALLALVLAVFRPDASLFASPNPVGPAVTDPRAPALPPEAFSQVSADLTLGEILAVLGPAADDVGSGLFVLRWRCTDGRSFLVGSPSMEPATKPLYAHFE
jgi:hypothetical protein